MVDSHLRAFLRTDVTGDASVFDVFHYFPSEDGPMEAGDLWEGFRKWRERKS